MKLLITGAFGNIGKTVLEEAYTRNHNIIVYEVDNKKIEELLGSIGIKLVK